MSLCNNGLAHGLHDTQDETPGSPCGSGPRAVARGGTDGCSCRFSWQMRLVGSVQHLVERLLDLQRLPHVAHGRIRIGAVEGHRRDLVLRNELFYAGATHSRVVHDLLKQQIDLVRDDRGEIVDIRLPVAVEGRSENAPGVVVEDY